MQPELNKQQTEALAVIRKVTAQLAADGIKDEVMGNQMVVATHAATGEEPTEKVLNNSRDSD
eukprot:26310-Eustigmatos_ZCMA.PRE.1